MRQARNSNVRPEFLLTPFDVMKFGSEEDPCFGKLYDLSELECQNCGDQEQCSILFLSKLRKKRLETEKKFPMKDLEIDNLEFKKEVRDYISKKRGQGFTDIKIKRFVKKKFNINPTKSHGL